MRLIRLVVKDFQSHRSLDVALGRIVTLRGETDVGKSAVLRALRWVCLNDMKGGDFVRHGAQQAEVTLIVRRRGVRHTIRRVKGPKVNLYQVDGKDLKAFGARPPQIVQNILGLDELNFQGQHDGPFWLGESAPEVSRRLNAVVDLSVMDHALSHAAGKTRSATERIAVVGGQLVELQDELRTAESARARARDFARLLELRRRHETLSVNLSKLGSLLAQVSEHEERRPPPDFSPIQDLWSRLQSRRAKAVQLCVLITDLSNQQKRLRDAEVIHEKLHRQLKGRTCRLCGQVLPV